MERIVPKKEVEIPVTTNSKSTRLAAVTPPICPYCREDTVLVDSIEVHSRSYGYLWLRDRCDARVGCHKGTQHPLGTPANEELRALRAAVHAALDFSWKKQVMTRSGVYLWLSEELDIPFSDAHVGVFNEQTCRRVIELCREKKRQSNC